MPPADLSRSQARRIALGAQGFARPRPSGRIDVRHIRRLIRELGLLQIDYINVLAPAHYIAPFSRLGPYPTTRLDDAVYRRREFTEQWAHEASIVPVESWPLLRHRRKAFRARPDSFRTFLERHPDYVEHVLDEVRERGPLTADDVPEPENAQRRLEHSWFGSVRRAVLETHFGRGALAVADRLPNFARSYDLSDRIVPAEHDERRIDADEARRELLRQAAGALGVATATDLADYFRMRVREARPRIAELVDAGELREVRVEDWSKTAFLHADARTPRRIDAAALLSPFDPVVWHRPRARRLFDFDYRLEIFIPAAKRKWGTYVLPFLLGERLVARVDLKADRDDRRLLVRAAYLEAGAEPGRVAPALARELRALAGWLDLDDVAVRRRSEFAAAVAAAVRA